MEYIKFYFVYSNKEQLLYIGNYTQENPPKIFNNTSIKYLKFKFPIKDKNFVKQLLHNAYKPKFSKIVFSN